MTDIWQVIIHTCIICITYTHFIQSQAKEVIFINKPLERILKEFEQYWLLALNEFSQGDVPPQMILVL